MEDTEYIETQHTTEGRMIAPFMMIQSVFMGDGVDAAMIDGVLCYRGESWEWMPVFA